MKKILVFDLDGTLFYRDQKISKNAVSKIIELQQKGCLVALATGRFLSELDPFIKELRIDEFQGFVIGANGCEVYDFLDHKRYDFEKISKDAVNDLVALARKMHLICYIHEKDAYHVYTSSLFLWIHRLLKPLFFRLPIPFFKAAASLQLESRYVLNQDVYDKVCVAGFPFRVRHFITKVRKGSQAFSYYEVSKFSYEILSKNVGKYPACKFLCEKRKRSMEDVIFFGDGGNDTELLEKVGLSYAMKNALPYVKKAAHHVSEYTNREDGVYKELVKLFDQ